MDDNRRGVLAAISAAAIAELLASSEANAQIGTTGINRNLIATAVTPVIKQLGTYVFTSNFGAVGDGVADNSVAWCKFGDQARIDSAAGKGVTLIVPPGTYNFRMRNCYYALTNIKKLHIIGYGATMQQTTNEVLGNSWFSVAFPAVTGGGNLTNQFNWEQNGGLPILGAVVPNFGTIAQPNYGCLGFLVNTTIPLTNTVTLTTAADNTNFAVGDYVLLGSNDVQTLGWPPNHDQFEYLTIKAINAGTGVITFDQNIRYQHRSDFPDYLPLTGQNAFIVGKARLWVLNSPNWQIGGGAGGINGYTFGTVLWDVEHIYEGFTINPTPSLSSPWYLFLGRSLTTINMAGVGNGPAWQMEDRHIGDKISYQNEIDKNIAFVTYERLIYRPQTVPGNSNTRWTHQSPGDLARYTDCYFDSPNGFIPGQFKHVIVEGCNIQLLSLADAYGLNRGMTFSNCRIFSFADFDLNFLRGASNGIIDGVYVTYSNGTFRVLKKPVGDVGAAAAGFPFSPQSSWAVQPGQQILLSGTGDMFVGDIGTGWVVAIREDATYYYIDTTLKHTVLPAWSNNKARIVKTGRVRFDNCTGCDNIRLASEATAAGFQAWELFRYRFMGVSGVNGYWGHHAGQLVRVKLNIIQATAVANTTFQLSMGTTYDATNPSTTKGAYNILFDVTVPGVREITTTTYVGKQTNDTITLNAVSQSFLPVNTLFALGSYLWAYTTLTPAPPVYLLPVMELELQFDCGMYRKVITERYDTSGSTLVGAVTGAPP